MLYFIDNKVYCLILFPFSAYVSAPTNDRQVQILHLECNFCTLQRS